jgi:hypothetical protein
MQIPVHWAEASARHRAAGRQVTVRRFGWSDLSADAAAALAQQRADDALARVLAGEKLDPREPKVAYNGADGVPIREQIVGRHGDTVLTRNSYGAVCLNTPDVLFADVDFDAAAAPDYEEALVALAMLVVGAIVWLIAGWLWSAVAGFATLFVVGGLANLVRRRRLANAGGADGAALARVAAFAQAHPDWRLRTYRTPAGLRLLAMHRRFAPGEPAVGEFFAAVGADRMYVRMCRNQQCFRARVSAKPWRIGIAGHLRPRPGVWPVNPERLPERERWLHDYDERALGSAACRFVGEHGAGAVDPHVDAVRLLHDDLCRSDTDLPLA